jgi:hypothetical protein
MCNVIDKGGEFHASAFVGSVADLDRNIPGLSDHLGLCPAGITVIVTD